MERATQSNKFVPSVANLWYIEGRWITTQSSCVRCNVGFPPDPSTAPGETLKLDLDSLFFYQYGHYMNHTKPSVLPMSSEEGNKCRETLRFACRALGVLLQPACPCSALPSLMSYTGISIFHRNWIKHVLQKTLLSHVTGCRRWWVHHPPCWAILISSNPLCWEVASDLKMKVVAFAPFSSERSKCLLPKDVFSVCMCLQSYQILSLSPFCHDKYFFLLKFYSISLAVQLWLLLAAPFWNPSAICTSLVVVDVDQKWIPLDKIEGGRNEVQCVAVGIGYG